MKKLYAATLGLSLALLGTACTKEKSDADLLKAWHGQCLAKAGERLGEQKKCTNLEKHARILMSHGKALPRKGTGTAVTIDEEKLGHLHHHHRKKESHKHDKRKEFRNCVGAAYATHQLKEKDYEGVVAKCRKKYQVHMTKEQLQELEAHVLGGITSYQTKRLEHRLKEKHAAKKKTASKAHAKKHAKK